MRRPNEAYYVTFELHYTDSRPLLQGVLAVFFAATMSQQSTGDRHAKKKAVIVSDDRRIMEEHMVKSAFAAANGQADLSSTRDVPAWSGQSGRARFRPEEVERPMIERCCRPGAERPPGRVSNS